MLKSIYFRSDGPIVFKAEEMTTEKPKVIKKHPMHKRPATITRRRRKFRKRKKKQSFWNFQNFSASNIFGSIKDIGIQTILGIDSIITDILNVTIRAGVNWYERRFNKYVSMF